MQINFAITVDITNDEIKTGQAVLPVAPVIRMPNDASNYHSLPDQYLKQINVSLFII